MMLCLKYSKPSLIQRGLFLLLALALSSCYVGRDLQVEKKIFVVDNSGLPITSSIDDAKYLVNVTQEDIKNSLLEGVKRNLPYHNLVVVPSKAEADFILDITKISISEKKDAHTVDDEDSEYHGQTYYLHTCTVDVDANILKASDGSFLSTGSATSDKEERISNKRNLGDVITGDNKDNNTYRFKDLTDDIFLDVADKTGDRLAGITSQKLYRLYKKGKIK